MALGARAADVFRLVLSSTTTSVGAGLLAGLILSLAFSKLAARWVRETVPHPPRPHPLRHRRQPHPRPPRRLHRPHVRPSPRIVVAPASSRRFFLIRMA